MIRPGEVAARFYARPYLLLTVTTLMWGANAVVARLAVGQVSPMALTTLRWLVALTALTAFARREIAAEWRALRRHAWPLFLMGSLGFTAFNALFYLAAHDTSAVNIGVIQGLMPAIVLIGGFVAFRTPIRPLQVVGVFVTLCGVAVVASRGDLDSLLHLRLNRGDLLMIIGSVFYAGYTVALRRRPPVSELAFFSAMSYAAFLSSVPLLGWEAAGGALLWPTPAGWALVVFVGLFPSLIAQIFFIRGVQLIGPNRAGVFINLVPVFAAALGVALIGETFAPYHALALVLVLAGIGIAQRGRIRTAAPSLA